MKTKLNDFVDEHEGILIFACFLTSGLVGYFLMHLVNFIP
jgi:hypothetical protein